MKEKRKKVAGAQGAKQQISPKQANSNKSKHAGLAEVFTLERNAQGEFEIIGCLREAAL
ncbi:MAG: hypothetical protein LBK94_05235 [Prevotellaceae bacterium]|jgi:hypothetical protein|nr:hypothetical protein [Prevotellaceae bacterium]